MESAVLTRGHAEEPNLPLIWFGLLLQAAQEDFCQVVELGK